ncbi:MAG TPA: hypothetical protein VF918_00425, partial [Anaerolineales bacterium]
MNKLQSSNWFMALQFGVIGGIAAILMSLVGMVEEFAKRDIVAGVIDMGQTLILIALLATGYFAVRRSPSTASFLRIIEGGVAGATAGLLLWLLVQSIAPLDLRTIFLNASPALIKILTLGREGAAALGLMLVLGALGGLAGALIQILPRRYSNATVQGLAWVALLGLLQDLIRVTLLNLPTIGDALQWMFGSRNEKGLSILGAVVVFVLVAGVSVLRSGQSSPIQARLRTLPAASQQAVRWISLALLAVILFYLPNVLGSYLSQVSNQVGLFLLMGLGLNIVVGFAGLLDLGYVAFFAIGAYVMGVLTTNAIGP